MQKTNIQTKNKANEWKTHSLCYISLTYFFLLGESRASKQHVYISFTQVYLGIMGKTGYLHTYWFDMKPMDYNMDFLYRALL